MPQWKEIDPLLFAPIAFWFSPNSFQKMLTLSKLSNQKQLNDEESEYFAPLQMINRSFSYLKESCLPRFSLKCSHCDYFAYITFEFDAFLKNSMLFNQQVAQHEHFKVCPLIK